VGALQEGRAAQIAAGSAPATMLVPIWDRSPR